MIRFDDYKMIDEIRKNGIKSNDKMANLKLKLIAQYYIDNTTYSEKEIIKRVIKIANEYYDGLSENFAHDDVKNIIKSVKEKRIELKDKKIITLYKSEMETISQIKDKNLKKIAFTTLVCFKHESQHMQAGKVEYYKSVKDCKTDIYRYADLGNVSGKNRTLLMNRMSDAGLINYFLIENKEHKWNQASWVAMTRFTVPFCVDIMPDKTNEEKWMDITNYDDILLYLRLYEGDKQVTICQNCGAPIVKKKAKRYCSDCATAMKKESDKKRYDAKMLMAN